jgi:hypothetical protein
MATNPEYSLKPIVGQTTYTLWTKMLNQLVPDGRTHRLAPLVAGMLQYACAVAEEKYGDNPEEDTAAYFLLNPPDYYEPGEPSKLLNVIEQLFEDAGVHYQRVNSRHEGYSIAENALYEFIHWYDMPWEA